MKRLDTEICSEHASGRANGEQLISRQRLEIIKLYTPVFHVIIRRNGKHIYINLFLTAANIPTNILPFFS
jgi:hypothetical protein